jgi:hypothetical protein
MKQSTLRIEENVGFNFETAGLFKKLMNETSLQTHKITTGCFKINARKLYWS